MPPILHCGDGTAKRVCRKELGSAVMGLGGVGAGGGRLFHLEDGTRPPDDAPQVGDDDEGEARVLSVPVGAVGHEQNRRQ